MSNQDFSTVVQIADRVAQNAMSKAFNHLVDRIPGIVDRIPGNKETIPRNLITQLSEDRCPSYRTVMARINSSNFPYQAILRAFFVSSPTIRQAINPQVQRIKAIFVVRNVCNNALKALGQAELPAGVIERLLAPETRA